jgi:hypothetical protein
MFSKLFGRKNLEHTDDKVWLNLEQKYRGIANEALGGIHTSALPIIVAHFSDSLTSIQTALELLSVPHIVYRSAIGGQQINTLALDNVLLVMAESLVGESGDGNSSERRVQIAVMEHHPLPPHDEQIVRFAESISGSVRLTFHASLDDSLLTLFGGDSVKTLWKQLDLPDDQPLVHALVGQSLQSAQRRIQQKARGDQPAASAAQWLQTNMP